MTHVPEPGHREIGLITVPENINMRSNIASRDAERL